jgi:hypothetical protein
MGTMSSLSVDERAEDGGMGLSSDLLVDYTIKGDVLAHILRKSLVSNLSTMVSVRDK